jgi:glutamate dehydrogenase
MMAVDKVALIVRDVVAETKKHKGDVNLAAFSRALLAGAAVEDLAPYRPQDLARLAEESLGFIATRTRGRPKIRSCNLEGALQDVTIIEIANDDMPFLVDSVLGLLNERGHEIRLLLHPVLYVRRDSQGKLIKLEEKSSLIADLTRESFMHVHVERIADGMREALEREIETALKDVRVAVLDWSAMQVRLKEAITNYQSSPPPIPVEDVSESIAFLQWLLDNHFTFLGMREYRFEGGAKKGQLTSVEGSGLGILRNPETQVLRKGGELVSITPEIRAFLMQPAALIITKSDVRANVHRRAVMDYIGVKLFNKQGELAGELRIVGLFTSTAYTRSPSGVPLIRRKLHSVVEASGFNPLGHSGKALLNVLETFPRDELFQIDTESLAEIAHGILRLEERPRTRLFVRRDRFDRFVSAFAFIPRDRFNSEVRQRVGEIIATAFAGRAVSFSPSFGESTLVRVHYIILRGRGEDPKPDLEKLEAQVVEAVRTWDDRLQSELTRAGLAASVQKWRGAFPAGYRERVTPRQSLKDVAELEKLAESSVAVEFVQPRENEAITLRLYRYGEAIPLSNRLPILENMGFKAIEETTYDISPQGKTAVIHDVLLRADGLVVDIRSRAKALETTFMAVWNGIAENDCFNALTLVQGMFWRDIALLRSFARYLRQGAAGFSADYMAQTLVKHSAIAVKIVNMFHRRFDPGNLDEAKAQKIAIEIEEGLAKVAALDEDRIIRAYCNLVGGIVRTGFFQERGSPEIINFKIDSKTIEGLPEPKPFAEIFVYSPDMEGLHLRFGKIARGGIRWSDRPEDYRREILGLAKAQNVKNVVIIPVGAKGGFVPKKLQAGASREQIQAEGVGAYRSFVSSLLDITDNLKDGRIEPPEGVLRRDGDDPYLVVAADKGTATFSDLANEISAAHGFWLDDAFASGGSAGYDHKKMGITARGAWEAVKRHFREMDIDIENTPITVMGVGDMSGDVFGNGMLLSRHLKLVAAFDHRDIFVDPEPDLVKSFEERKRLFEMPRSSWQDYDRTLISAGGGVFSRGLKAIPLSDQLKKLTGLGWPTATPHQIMNALLKASVDLIWFGGIGTFIRSSAESNSEVGDRANDGVRVNASEIRAKVIGEGANLGVTQRGRVEYARLGGRINTDAIDNSAGVNSSDMEVNLKIALSVAEREGKIDHAQRNRLLFEMSEEVAGLVLRNNYLQTLSLSLAVAHGTEENSYAILLMHDLEAKGLLDRDLEALPQDAEIKSRDARRETLTRPEFAVLQAYAKISLNKDLLESDVPDDEYLSRELERYFPQRMVAAHRSEIKRHSLRREVIATMLANGIINRGGPGFVARLMSETGAPAAQIAAAFAVARDSFDLTTYNQAIDALDNTVSGSLQIGIYLVLQALLRRATQWFLRNSDLQSGLNEIVARYRKGIDELKASLMGYLPPDAIEALERRAAELREGGVPGELARMLASLAYLQRAPDIVQVASECRSTLGTAARVLFASGTYFGMDGLLRRASELVAKDFFERLAINRTIDQLFLAHRAITSRVLTSHAESPDPFQAWMEAYRSRIKGVTETIHELSSKEPFDLAKLSVAQGLLWDLATAGRGNR